MFGDEPYGNYNRIMLVQRAGRGGGRDRHLPQRPVLVRRQRHHAARRRPGRPGSTGSPSVVFADDGSVTPYDKLIIATGSRAFVPPMPGCTPPTARLPPGRLRLPHARRHPRHDPVRPRTTARAVVIGGGLLGLEAARGLQQLRARRCTWCTPAGHLMNAAARRRRPARSCSAASRGSASRCTPAPAPPRSSASDAVTGVKLRRRPATSPCDMVVVAAGIRPNGEVAADQRAHRRARHRRRRPDARRSTSRTSTRSASACSTAARCTAWSPRCGSRPRCWPTTSPAPTRTPRTTARGPRRSSRSPGVDVASMGLTEPERDDDETWSFSEPRTRRLQERGHPRRPADRRHPGRRRREGRVPDAGLRPRAAAAGGAGRAAVRPRRPAGRGRAPPRCADDAQVCNCNGVTKGTIARLRAAAAARRVAGVMDATRAGKGCGSCKALVAQIVEWAAGGDGRGGPGRATGTCPASRCDKPELMAAIREQRADVGLGGVRRARARRRGGRQEQDGPGLAAAR